MSTNVTHLADNVLPVTRGQGLTISLSTGAESIVDLRDPLNRPASLNTDEDKNYWSGLYVTLQADGGDVYFYFTDDGVAGLVGTPNAGVWGARQGAKILDGQTVDQLLPVAPSPSSQGGSGTPPVWKRRYLHAIKAAGAGNTFLSIWPSSTRAMLCAACLRRAARAVAPRPRALSTLPSP